MVVVEGKENGKKVSRGITCREAARRAKALELMLKHSPSEELHSLANSMRRAAEVAYTQQLRQVRLTTGLMGYVSGDSLLDKWVLDKAMMPMNGFLVQADPEKVEPETRDETKKYVDMVTIYCNPPTIPGRLVIFWRTIKQAFLDLIRWGR